MEKEYRDHGRRADDNGTSIKSLFYEKPRGFRAEDKEEVEIVRIIRRGIILTESMKTQQSKIEKS